MRFWQQSQAIRPATPAICFGKPHKVFYRPAVVSISAMLTRRGKKNRSTHRAGKVTLNNTTPHYLTTINLKIPTGKPVQPVMVPPKASVNLAGVVCSGVQQATRPSMIMAPDAHQQRVANSKQRHDRESKNRLRHGHGPCRGHTACRRRRRERRQFNPAFPAVRTRTSPILMVNARNALPPGEYNINVYINNNYAFTGNVKFSIDWSSKTKSRL